MFYTTTYNNLIDNESWEDYFNKLYQKSSNVEEVITGSTNSVSYLNHEEVAIDKIINHRITKSEVKKAIKKLKNGKSAGEDNIINDVLKTGEFCLVDSIVKLLNLILQLEKYPLKWTRNLLVTLHKGGPTDEPNNYRGNSIS